MQIEQLQHEFERVQAELAAGPIVPSVTVDEIRSYLGSQYQFQKELPLDEVIEDAERCPHCETYISREDAPGAPRSRFWMVMMIFAILAVALLALG